jgi:hypothetical protein
MKRCPDYVGLACNNGSCPLTVYEDNPDYFDSKPRCKDCGYYKGGVPIVRFMLMTEHVPSVETVKCFT